MAHAISLHDYAAAGEPGLFARARKALADYQAYRAVLDELKALSDRELSDLGISRLNIRDVARQAAYGA